MLAWPEGLAPPDEEALVADARVMVRTMPPLERDACRPISSHVTLTLSPVWIENEGEACLKMAAMPTAARSRFWMPPAVGLLERDEVMTLPAQIVALFTPAPEHANAALEDTLRFWWDERAPLRRLGLPWRPHYGLLSALLADLVRKASAGFDTLEWYASLGVPLDGVLGPGDPDAARVQVLMSERSDAMLAEEELWNAEALDG